MRKINPDDLINEYLSVKSDIINTYLLHRPVPGKYMDIPYFGRMARVYYTINQETGKIITITYKEGKKDKVLIIPNDLG